METRTIEPFDTVVNFDEDFHSHSEASERYEGHAGLSSEPPSSGKNAQLNENMNSPHNSRANYTNSKLSEASPNNSQPCWRSSRHSSRGSVATNPPQYNRDSCRDGRPTSPNQPCRPYSPPEREHPRQSRLPIRLPSSPTNSTLITMKSSSSDGPALMTSDLRLEAVVMPDSSDTQVVKLAPRSSELGRLECGMSRTAAVSRVGDSGNDEWSFVEERRTVPRTSTHSSHPENEVWVRERFEMVSEVGSLVCPNNGAKCVCVDPALHDKTKQVCTVYEKYESELTNLKSLLAKRTEEAEKIAHELAVVKTEGHHAQERLCELTRTGSMKSDTVVGLKKKVAELYADAESLRCAYSQAVDHQTDLQEEIASLKRSRDWYSEQLRLAQCVRDRIQSETERLQTLLKEGGEINHRIAHENACLQAQLACSRAALADTKRNLSRQLESVRVDMIEREAIFERIATERASFEELNRHRAEQIAGLQCQITSLKTDLKTSKAYAEAQRKQLEVSTASLEAAELKRRELHDRLTAFERQNLQNQTAMGQQAAEYSAALCRITALEQDNATKDVALAAACEQKNALNASLSAAQREKSVMDCCLSKLKDDLARVESNMDNLRCELHGKNAQLVELCSEKDKLTQRVEQLQCANENARKCIEALRREKDNLLINIHALQTENGSLRNDLTRLGCVLEKADVAIQEARRGSPHQGGVLQIGMFNRPHEHHNMTPERAESTSRSFVVDDHWSEKEFSPFQHYFPQRRYPERQTAPAEYDLSMPSETVFSKLFGKISDKETHANACDNVVGTTELNPSRRSNLPKEHPAHLQELERKTPRKDPRVGRMDSVPIMGDQANSDGPSSFDGASDPHLAVNDLEFRLGSSEVDSHNSRAIAETTLADQLRDYAIHQMNASSRPESISRPRQPNGRQTRSSSKHEYGHRTNSNTADRLPFQQPATGSETNVAELALKTNQKRNSLTYSMGPRAHDVLDEGNRLSLVKRASSVIIYSTEEGDMPHLEKDNQLLSEAFSPASREAADALAGLTIARREAETQAAIAERAISARQQAVEAKQAALAELEATKSKAAVLESQVNELRQEVQSAKEEAALLRARQDANATVHGSELEALRAIIKTVTEHLAAMSTSLKETTREKLAYQTELAQLKGGLRAQLERFRLFARIEASGSTQPTDDTDQPTMTRLTAAGLNLNGLEDLLGEAAERPLLHSKPLHGLTKCFETLQTEITKLEDQVVYHAMAVHDSVEDWKQLRTDKHMGLSRLSEEC